MPAVSALPFSLSLNSIKQRIVRVATGVGDLIVFIPDQSAYRNLPSTSVPEEARIRSHWDRVGESFQSAIAQYKRETAKTQ
jgi:hypothetical protein